MRDTFQLLMGSTTCSSDVMFIFNCSLNAECKTFAHLFDGHGSHVWMILDGCIWNMDETAACIWELMFELIQQMIHQVVADIGAGCVGNSSRTQPMISSSKALITMSFFMFERKKFMIHQLSVFIISVIRRKCNVGQRSVPYGVRCT